MQAIDQEIISNERPVRTFVKFDGQPCLIADKNKNEYKLVTLSEHPRYLYVNKNSLQELPKGESIEKPTPYRISRLLDIMDPVFILWTEKIDGKEKESITFGYYISVNYEGSSAYIIDDKKQMLVKNTPTKSIKEVFYFKIKKG